MSYHNQSLAFGHIFLQPVLEIDVRAKGRKAIKALEEKLGAEEKAHVVTKEEKDKLQEEFLKLQAVNTGLLEVLDKKKVWYEEQLTEERESLHQEKIRLRKEMGRMEELHSKESEIWVKMKSHYEEVVVVNKRKIENLKKHRFAPKPSRKTCAFSFKQIGRGLRCNSKQH
mgnify:CR=1 FL=1